MKIFYWIRYNLGKVLIISIVIWALITGLKFFFPSMGSSKNNKSRPSSIDFRPVKEGRLSNYTRRPRQMLEKIKSPAKKSRTQTYSDSAQNDSSFTLSDETQAMLVVMKKELSDYGILMDDLLAAVELHFQKNKKSKKAPTKNDIMALLPDHVKELVPENKRKFSVPTRDDKNKKTKKQEGTPDTGLTPTEVIVDGQEVKLEKENPEADASETPVKKKSKSSLSEESSEEEHSSDTSGSPSESSEDE